MGFIFGLGVVAGIILAISITMFIMISIIKKANDWGDDYNGRKNVSTCTIIEKKDNVKAEYDVGTELDWLPTGAWRLRNEEQKTLPL